MSETVWQRNEFPTHLTQSINGWDGTCERWFAARRTMANPFCWTPTEPFVFGGKRFIALYPCIAFATRNFGWICQQRWNGVIMAGK